MRFTKKRSSDVSSVEVAPRRKRSWKSRLGELLLWTLVAIGTALIMISMSETLLPSNF